MQVKRKDETFSYVDLGLAESVGSLALKKFLRMNGPTAIASSMSVGGYPLCRKCDPSMSASLS